MQAAAQRGLHGPRLRGSLCKPLQQLRLLRQWGFPVVCGNRNPGRTRPSLAAAAQPVREPELATLPRRLHLKELGAGAAPPAAAGSEPEHVRRSAVLLAACLACDLCGRMLDDPVTVPECMHRCACLCFIAIIAPGCLPGGHASVEP